MLKKVFKIHNSYFILAVIFFIVAMIISKNQEANFVFNIYDIYYVFSFSYFFWFNTIVLFLYWIGFYILFRIKSVFNVNYYYLFVTFSLIISVGTIFPFEIFYNKEDIFSDPFIKADLLTIIFNLLNLILITIFIINIIICIFRTQKTLHSKR